MLAHGLEDVIAHGLGDLIARGFEDVIAHGLEDEVAHGSEEVVALGLEEKTDIYEYCISRTFRIPNTSLNCTLLCCFDVKVSLENQLQYNVTVYIQ